MGLGTKGVGMWPLGGSPCPALWDICGRGAWSFREMVAA